MNAASNSVQTYLDDLKMSDAEQAQIAEKLLSLFRSQNTDLSEDIKYGGIVFLQNGKIIGGIYSYKDHLSVEFSKGANFDDPENQLEGKGKLRRHLKFKELSDVDQTGVEGFIKQAV